MSDTEDEEVQRNIKITIVGEPSTGKSSLCARYLSLPSPAGCTRGAEVRAGQCLGLRPPVALHLCDVAGAARTTDMLDNYLYASDIVIFVYDLTNLQSFDKLGIWLKKVEEVFEVEGKKPLMAMFGNKSDLEHQRAVRLSVVQKFASDHMMESFKGSARTGEMVNHTITSLVARALGSKVRRAPAVMNGKSPMYKMAQQNGHVPLPLSTGQPTQSLIMTRKALRRMQRKASSSVCSVQ